MELSEGGGLGNLYRLFKDAENYSWNERRKDHAHNPNCLVYNY